MISSDPRRQALLRQRLASRVGCEECMLKYDAAVGEDAEGMKSFLTGSIATMFIASMLGIYIITA